MSASEDIVFDGGEGQCERFIRLVRKAAFAQGKLEDSKWVAMFASTCFEGKALRWYSALDSATKVDWHLLEPALLAEFSGPVLSGQAEEKMPSVERESSIPTPAAAPPPSATGWESSRPSSPTAYEPSAAATAPPEPPLPSAPWPPPSAATPTESNAGPAPPPPPRKNTSTSSYQTGSSFRPPPRHPSAASGSSPSVAPSPGLYGSHIPAQNPAAAPPPPPSRINSFKAQSPQDQWKNEVPSPSQPGRETPNNRYEGSAGSPDAPGGTAYSANPSWQSSIPQQQPSNTTNPANNGQQLPSGYSGHAEPQTDPSPPPPPPPRREQQFPPPPPRREPPPGQQQAPQNPNTGWPPPGVPPQFAAAANGGIPPQFTGGSGPGVSPQYTGNPYSGPQHQYANNSQAPQPPPYSSGPITARRGRIRVTDTSGGTYWVRQSLNWFGGYKRTSKLGEAVVVIWDPVKEPGRLRLLNPTNQQTWIGLTWASVARGAVPVLGKGSKDHADMAAIGEMPSGTFSSASHRDGPSEAEIWLMHGDGTLEPRLSAPYGVKLPLDIAVGSGTKWVWLVSDFETFALSNIGQIKSKLVFEPI